MAPFSLLRFLQILFCCGLAQSLFSLSCSAQTEPKVSVSNIEVKATSSSVQVSWLTDRDASSKLFLSAIPGQITSPYCSVLVDDTPKRKHALAFSHLPSGLPVWLRVESEAEGHALGASPVLHTRTGSNLRSFLYVGPTDEANAPRVERSTPSLGNTTAAGPWQFFGGLDDHVGVGRLIKEGKPGVVVLAVHLWYPQDQLANLVWQGQRKATFSLNRKVLGEHRGDGKGESTTRLEANLTQGWNLLTVRLHVENEADSFKAHFADHPDNAPLTFTRVAYTDPTPRFEVKTTALDGGRHKVDWRFIHPYVNPRWIAAGWEMPTIRDLAKTDLEKLQNQYDFYDGVSIWFDRDFNLTPYGGFWPFERRIKLNREKLADQIELLKSFKFTHWRHNFLWVAAYLQSTEPVDWMYDEATWKDVLSNFRTIAHIAKETGMKGLLFDCETGASHTVFNYGTFFKEKEPDGHKAMQRAFERGRELMRVIEEEAPGLAIISVDSSRVDIYSRSVFNFHWDETKRSSSTPGMMPHNSKHRLFTSLLAGMTAAATGESTIIDGEYSPRIGTNLEGPAYSTRAWHEVLPHWQENPEQKLKPEAWIKHSGISGRANTYDAPGRDRMDAGMTQKLVALSNASNADYLWTYWQSVVPGYGWHEYYWLPASRRKEMEDRLRKKEIKSFVPSFLNGEPAEMFEAIAKARKTTSTQVQVLADGKVISNISDGQIELAGMSGKKLEFFGTSDGGSARAEITLP